MNSFRETREITLQQDWAPTYRAKSLKSWLQNNNIAFWDENIYPAASPDLIPMDFSVWGWMLHHLHDMNILGHSKPLQPIKKISVTDFCKLLVENIVQVRKFF